MRTCCSGRVRKQASISCAIRKCAVLHAAEREQGRHGTDEAHEHVSLRVPGIALSAEKCVRRLTSRDRHAPFEQFIARAYRKAEADDDRHQPARAFERSASKQQLARDHGRHEALEEVADAIVVIARKVRSITKPVERWHLRVGVVPSDHQYPRMQQDERVDKARERKVRPRDGKHGGRNERRRDLQPPGEAIEGPNRGPCEHHREADAPERDAATGRGLTVVTTRAPSALVAFEGDAAEKQGVHETVVMDRRQEHGVREVIAQFGLTNVACVVVGDREFPRHAVGGDLHRVGEGQRPARSTLRLAHVGEDLLRCDVVDAVATGVEHET